VSASVTKLAVCVECGAPFEQPPTGRRRRHCKNACKQSAWRKRRSFVTAAPPELAADLQQRAEGVGSAVRRAWFELDKDQRGRARDYLAAEIERLRRMRDAQRGEAGKELFANDPGRIA
jgi:hypothetical protein